MPNRVALIKDTLPGAVRMTERDTFVFDWDGERHVHPTYRSAASELAKLSGLGSHPGAHGVDLEAVWRRLGRPGAPHPGTHPGEPARASSNGNGHGRHPMPANDMVPHPGGGTRRRSAKQPRSIKVELPQSVISELLGRGRAKIMLSVRR